MKHTCLFGVGAGVLLTAAPAAAQLPAFPGADGAGAMATGGRGGVVYHVTKLDKNYSDAGEGTLRYGLNDNHFKVDGKVQPRTIVFDVGGVFWLGRFGTERGHDNGWDASSRLNLGSHVTIAGQTAPGGVYIMGGVVKASGTNIVMRAVTIAPGYGLRSFAKPEDGVAPMPGDFPDRYTYDAVDISGTGMVFDQLTAVHATDETISANESADDITVQYSVIARAQNYPQADAEAGRVRYTGHALGSLFQMGSGANLSVHHNLYVHQKGRLPRVGTDPGDLADPAVGAYNDFRNNVFYNWYNTAGTGAAGQPSQSNFINNFYLAGPGGDDVLQQPGPDGEPHTLDDTAVVVHKAGGIDLFDGNDDTLTRIYHRGNVKDTNKDGDADDAVAATDADYKGSAPQPTAFAHTPYAGVTDTAGDAFKRVLGYAGAYGGRSPIDTAVVNVDARLKTETLSGAGQVQAWADDPFNDDPEEGVEWRALLALRADPHTGAAPFSRPAGWDTDRDGMPDAWEAEHGLDPDTPNNNADFDRDGYTDLEEYLNEIAAIPASQELSFNNADGTGRYEAIGNWGHGVWQPSRFDDVEIGAGEVTVDSAGQHARRLVIASADGASARLTITGGWLKVRDQLALGEGREAVGGLVLSSGVLFVGMLSKNAVSEFTFTGGELHADRVTFSLDTGGGTLAPGDGIGTTTVEGALDLGSGAVQIELAGVDQFDRVVVTDRLALAGRLELSPINGYVPALGQSFEVMASAAGVINAFRTISGVAYAPGRGLAVTYTSTGVTVTAALSGDTDLDGDVDNADLRQAIGRFTGPAASGRTWADGDSDGDGDVDTKDIRAAIANFIGPIPPVNTPALGSLAVGTLRAAPPITP